MKEYIIPLCIIIFFITIYLFYELYKYYIHKEIKKLSAWIITKKNTEHRYMSLFQYVHKAQLELEIPEKYKISFDTEQDTTNEILSAFQNYFTELYLDEKVFIPKYKMFSKRTYQEVYMDFFMLYLFNYLKEHRLDSRFLGYDMHSKTISSEPYLNGTDTLYFLSDFAFVFNKLYYIAYRYCINSQLVYHYSSLFLFENDITNILDTKQIKILHYMP